MVAIETDGLTKHFGDLVAVDDIDMHVEEGEAFGFLGPNGAGKSTTINILLGFLDPTEGSATVLGHDVEHDSLAAREDLGILPEGFTPYDRLTAREHIAYAAGIKECTPDTEALLSRVGLQEDAWDRRAGGYSKGMRQRLGLATALVGDPDLLILDEPSTGLDPEGMQEVRELIRSETDEGTTVFFSSHILSEVEAVCDRIGMLVDGRLAASGTLDELRDGASVRAPVELTVDEPPPDVESELEAMETVVTAAVEDRTIEVEIDDPARKVDVIKYVDARARVEDVIAEEASLEAMFELFASGELPLDDADGTASDGRAPAEPGEVAR